MKITRNYLRGYIVTPVPLTYVRGSRSKVAILKKLLIIVAVAPAPPPLPPRFPYGSMVFSAIKTTKGSYLKEFMTCRNTY